jgi:hypothetical protein
MMELHGQQLIQQGALTTSGQGARGAGTTGAGIASSFQGGGGTPSAYTDVKELGWYILECRNITL